MMNTIKAKAMRHLILTPNITKRCYKKITVQALPDLSMKHYASTRKAMRKKQKDVRRDLQIADFLIKSELKW